MGEYFLMSKRFNKCHASDFGLVPCDIDTAINPTDNSKWIKTNLYDFGWGKENGYYKKPLPEFSQLFEMVLHSKNEDDAYGAAAIILEQYSEELLIQCERSMTDKKQKKLFRRLVLMFKLNVAVNRSPVLQKSLDQVQNDYERWKKISEIAKKTSNNFFWSL